MSAGDQSGRKSAFPRRLVRLGQGTAIAKLDECVNSDEDFLPAVIGCLHGGPAQ